MSRTLHQWIRHKRRKRAEFRAWNRFFGLYYYVMDELERLDGSAEPEKVLCILFRADFSCYRATGKPLLGGGLRWRKGKRVPVPYFDGRDIR